MSESHRQMDNSLKRQIEFWFLRYFRKSKEDFFGTEPFTLFGSLNEVLKDRLTRQLNLYKDELPVLVLTVKKDELIVNTTRRFIRLQNVKSDCIHYTDFEWHSGFKSFAINPDGKFISIKANGYTAAFGLKLKSGEVVYWDIPTGEAGFAFWNVTKKCDVIGRRLLDQQVL